MFICAHCVIALTAHLTQAPPLQYDSCVFLPGPASLCALASVACIYSHSPFPRLAVSVCILSLGCLCSSCAPPPPLLFLPAPSSLICSDFLRRAHRNTRCMGRSGSEPPATACLQRTRPYNPPTTTFHPSASTRF